MNKVSSVKAGDFAKQTIAAKCSMLILMDGWMDGCLKIETRLANIGDHSFGNVKCIAIIAPHGFSLCKCIDSRNCLYFPTSYMYMHSIVDLRIEKTCFKFLFKDIQLCGALLLEICTLTRRRG